MTVVSTLSALKPAKHINGSSVIVAGTDPLRTFEGLNRDERVLTLKSRVIL